MKYLHRPWPIYLIWVALCCLFFWKPLAALVLHSFYNDNASYILVIPLIAAWLLYTDRAKLSKTCLDFYPALLFGLTAVLVGGISRWGETSWTGMRLSLAVLSLVLLLTAGFIGVFGRLSSEKTWFSFAFLGFAVPIPEPQLDRVIYLLQCGSAAVAEQIFQWSGVPVLRENFVFYLPDLSIEVARECSGIRSSIALVILALLVAHFAFSKLWKKAVLVCAGLAMMPVKNGVRIATLTILAHYVNPDFLFGRLHHEGGVVFFLVALLLLAPVYWLLRRGEPAHCPPASV